MPFVFETVISIAPPLPLALQGSSLPTAFMGQPYGASLIGFTSGGIGTLTYTQTSAAGPGTFSTSISGVVSGIPAVSNAQVMDDGTYTIDDLGDVIVT